jgi:hypothetical protein
VVEGQQIASRRRLIPQSSLLTFDWTLGGGGGEFGAKAGGEFNPLSILPPNSFPPSNCSSVHPSANNYIPPEEDKNGKNGRGEWFYEILDAKWESFPFLPLLCPFLFFYLSFLGIAIFCFSS